MAPVLAAVRQERGERVDGQQIERAGGGAVRGPTEQRLPFVRRRPGAERARQ
ncbi:MAG TPA: hypothetical protein VGJ05_10555 [Fimbriiglobus sp.]|jgi:hypothetical protein